MTTSTLKNVKINYKGINLVADKVFVKDVTTNEDIERDHQGAWFCKAMFSFETKQVGIYSTYGIGYMEANKNTLKTLLDTLFWTLENGTENEKRIAKIKINSLGLS